MQQPRLIEGIYGRFWCWPDDLITHHIEAFGAHTRNEISFLLSHIRENDVVIDIGAHVGSYTVPIGRKIGALGRILSIEGDAANYSLLVQNVSENNLADRIVTKNAILGCGDSVDLVRTDIKGNTGAGFYSRPDKAAPYKDLQSMQDARRIVAEAGFDKPNVIKIDIEGMEGLVIKSLWPIIIASKPVLYIEVFESQLVRNGSGADALDALLKSAGYRFYRNIGERNSLSDTFQSSPLDRLADGGPHFDVLALPWPT